MKKILSIVATTMIVLLGTTSCKSVGQSNTVSDYINTDSSSIEYEVKQENNADKPINMPSTDNSLNMPKELYIPANKRTSKATYHDFSVDRSMDFTISVELESGTIKLGIFARPDLTNNRENMISVYDIREWGSEVDSVSLEPGNYAVKVETQQFTGSYHIIGK